MMSRYQPSGALRYWPPQPGFDGSAGSLPLEERLDVLRFVREYETVPKLSPEELGELGERMVNATDPEEVAALEKALVNGFYGMKIDA